MDVICFGSIVVDHRRSAETSGTAAEPLRIVASAVDLHVGGVPILATTLRRMGFDVALMGCVGHDIAGYGLKLYLENEIGLNVDGSAMAFCDFMGDKQTQSGSLGSF